MEEQQMKMNNSTGCAQIDNSVKVLPTISIPMTQPIQPEYVASFASQLAEVAKNNQVNIMIGCFPPMQHQQNASTPDYDYADLIQKMAENAIKNSIPWPPLENLKQTTADETESSDDCCCDECTGECNNNHTSVCDTCDCRDCELAKDNSATCPVRLYSCHDCDGQDPIGVEHAIECTLLKEYLPVMRRFQQLTMQLTESYREMTDNKKGYKFITSTGGTDGRLSVTVMFGNLRKAAFSLELHCNPTTGFWEYRVPRSKRIKNPYSDETPEGKIINQLIKFAEDIVVEPYDLFLKKYECMHEDLVGDLIEK